MPNSTRAPYTGPSASSFLTHKEKCYSNSALLRRWASSYAHKYVWRTQIIEPFKGQSQWKANLFSLDLLLSEILNIWNSIQRHFCLWQNFKIMDSYLCSFLHVTHFCIKLRTWLNSMRGRAELKDRHIVTRFKSIRQFWM